MHGRRVGLRRAAIAGGVAVLGAGGLGYALRKKEPEAAGVAVVETVVVKPKKKNPPLQKMIFGRNTI